MSRPQLITRSFRYEARAGRGEEITLWALEVDGRFRPISMLPTKHERRDDSSAYRGDSELKGPEGAACLFDDTRRPGQIWEKRVEVTAPVGARVRKRTVVTAQAEPGLDVWDYIRRGVLQPQRRYRDQIFVLTSDGRLMSEARYLARRDQPRESLQRSTEVVRPEFAAHAARALLQRLG